jgi:hypothetical protein
MRWPGRHLDRLGGGAVPQLRGPDVAVEAAMRDDIDLFGVSLTPRAFFSERRAMERMGDARLGLHLILRSAWHRVPFGGWRWRLVAPLWRLYRRTW